MAYNFVADSMVWVYLHTFSCCCFPKSLNPAKFRQNLTLQQLRSSKVINLGVNRKRTCDFLLVINSKLSSTVFEILTLKARNGLFPHPCLVSSCLKPRSGGLVKIYGWNLLSKTIGTGLQCGENFVILTATAFDWSTRETDRQTDERTFSARQIQVPVSVPLSSLWHYLAPPSLVAMLERTTILMQSGTYTAKSHDDTKSDEQGDVCTSGYWCQ